MKRVQIHVVSLRSGQVISLVFGALLANTITDQSLLLSEIRTISHVWDLSSLVILTLLVTLDDFTIGYCFVIILMPFVVLRLFAFVYHHQIST